MSEEGRAGLPGPADLAAQLRAAADRLMAGWTSMAGAGGTAAGGTPKMPDLPTMPATLSARQMEALLEDLAARRAQVQALRTHLEGFDEQLGTLEANLRPLLEWTRNWANVESTISDFWRPLSGGAGP